MDMTREIQANFAQWFLNKFLDWQKSKGGLKTGVDFAEHLGVSQSAVSKWLRGEGYPQRRLYIEQIASRLGDEIYDVLGLDRPEHDRRFQDLASIWEKLPNATQDEILRTARQSIEQQREAGTTTPPVAKPTRKRAN